MFINVSDHVTLKGQAYRYVQGLNGTEKQLAMDDGDHGIHLVAKFPFRQGYRWYYIIGISRLKRSSETKTRLAHMYIATPVGDPHFIIYLDLANPKAKAKRG